ncbi:MAG: HepT-like ribonuclease domain-containing protein [Pirellulales bacterium]
MRQMLDHASEARQLASGRSRDDLDSDRVFHLAMTRLLEIVGEAAGRVSQASRDHYPQIAWPQIVGLRLAGYGQGRR